ncbi:polysaccharide deacetylase family protein [Aquimarina litoralis]|uniref:polysaccharide deacetylase family protein n=1 Tax=Aquimarina litoralis TaxID=584605 RepID=UPI0031B88508
MFPNYIWDFYNRKEKKIYLTFDDGPIPEITEFVLEQLQLYNAKATFFCIGDNIRKHPDVFKKIIHNGHGIGNHTMHHVKARKTSFSDYIEDVLLCEDEISKHFPFENKLFRPPYGQLSKSKLTELKRLGYQIILWDILAKDWMKSMTPEECFKIVTKNSKEGSIIIFHDSIKASKNLIETLPRVLAHFIEKGFILDKI